MPTLILYYPEKEKRWRVNVTKETFVIGRSVEADVRIPLPSVSKQHVRVERSRGRFAFHDLESRNGVLLNGFRVRQGALTDGDELQLGAVRVTFYKHAPPKPSRAPPAPGRKQPAKDAADQDDLDLDGVALDDVDLEDIKLEDVSLEDADLEADLDALSLLPQQDNGETLLLQRDALQDLEAQARRTPHAVKAHPHTDRHTRLHLAPPPRRWRLSGPGLALLVACSVGGGLLLGLAASWLGRDGEGGPAPAKTPIVDPVLSPMDPGDEEARHRVVFRLFFDLLGRPPLRLEVEKLAGLSLEETWAQIDFLREKSSSLPEADLLDVTKAFPRFLGRDATGEEIAELLERSGKDPKYFIFHLTTSRAYASAEHRRKKSHEQLARSLYVDFLEKIATKKEAQGVIEALRSPQGGMEKVARMFADRATTAPSKDNPTADWCRRSYLRFLLRPPSSEEETAAAAAAGKDPEGWREVLFELALRPEYREY